MKGTALKKYCKKKDEEVKKDEEEERRKKKEKKEEEKTHPKKDSIKKSSFHQQPNHNVHPFHVLYRVCSYLYFKFSIVIMISRLSIITFFFLLLVRTCMYIISTVFKLYKNKLFFAFFSVRLLLLCNI
jgi:hypothetical protein